VLRTLLEDCSGVGADDVESVWRWKQQVKTGSDDITLDFNGSALDFLRFGRVLDDNQSCGPPSIMSTRVAPKLKSVSSEQIYSGHRGSLEINAPDTRRRTERGLIALRSGRIQHSPLSFTDDESQISEHVAGSCSEQNLSMERYVSLGYVNNVGFAANFMHTDKDWFQVGHSRAALSNNSEMTSSLSEPSLDKANHSSHKRSQDPFESSRINSASNHALKQDMITVSDVYNSNLDTEEKLDIMARICSGEFSLNEEIYYKLKPDPRALKTARPPKPKTEMYKVPKSVYSGSNLEASNNQKPTPSSSKTAQVRLRNISGARLTHPDNSVPGRGKLYKKSSIKVAEWMQKLEHQPEMSWPQRGQRSPVKQGDHSIPR